MNNKLLVKMEHLPERVSEDFSTGNIHAWGKLELCLLKENGIETCLLSVEWYMRYFVNWFIDFHYPHVYELHREKQIDENISNFVRRIGSDIAEKPYAEAIKFHNFVKRHNISYASPGLATPHIFIGFSGECGEVSLDSTESADLKLYMGDVWFYKGQWELFFDIDHYIYSALVEIETFLWRWQIEGDTKAEEYKLLTLEKLETLKQNKV